MMKPRADGIIVWKMGWKGLYNCMLLMGIGSVTALIFYYFPLICVQISYLHTNKRSLSQAKLHNLESISKFYSKLL